MTTYSFSDRTGFLYHNNSTDLFQDNIILMDNSTLHNGYNISTSNDTLDLRPHGPPPPLGVEVRIVLYSIIFILSIVGNSLVILTLVQNRRMRTVTNVFLLNLSVSDLLLAVFCMPFTLIPTILRNFIFGKAMCVMIRYMQAVSVGVSVFTLVSISLERYFAICEPLRSRSWQTISHSYKMIVFVWLFSCVIMIPIAVFQRLVPLGWGTHKCMEDWDNGTLEKVYAIFLDCVLLVFPLVLMFLAYSLISWKLWKGIQVELKSVQELRELKDTTEDHDTDDDMKMYGNGDLNNGFRRHSNTKTNKTSRPSTSTLRQSNTDRNNQARKRVIRMLFVIVLEFFVCWTPMYVLQTWKLFDEESVTEVITPLTMNMIHLLSYVSSCCNPITYCFMNRKFRQGFLSAFRCRCVQRKDQGVLTRRPSDYTFASQRTGMVVQACDHNDNTPTPKYKCKLRVPFLKYQVRNNKYCSKTQQSGDL